MFWPTLTAITSFVVLVGIGTYLFYDPSSELNKNFFTLKFTEIFQMAFALVFTVYFSFQIQGLLSRKNKLLDQQIKLIDYTQEKFEESSKDVLDFLSKTHEPAQWNSSMVLLAFKTTSSNIAMLKQLLRSKKFQASLENLESKLTEFSNLVTGGTWGPGAVFSTADIQKSRQFIEDISRELQRLKLTLLES